MADQTTTPLTPMWQRIAAGEVDLARYSDEEILSGQIRMPDGRLLPTPPVFPEVWEREQVRRGLRKAQRQIRDGALRALEVYEEILEGGEGVEAKDRLKAAEFFTTRFLGKPDQHVHVHKANPDEARELLVQRLLAARQGLPAPVSRALANGEDVGDIVDGEIVEDATLHLRDLEDLI